MAEDEEEKMIQEWEEKMIKGISEDKAKGLEMRIRLSQGSAARSCPAT